MCISVVHNVIISNVKTGLHHLKFLLLLFNTFHTVPYNNAVWVAKQGVRLTKSNGQNYSVAVCSDKHMAIYTLVSLPVISYQHTELTLIKRL